jgi:hypothetical protein
MKLILINEHGGFWTDGSGCENCLDDKEDYEELGEQADYQRKAEREGR